MYKPTVNKDDLLTYLLTYSDLERTPANKKRPETAYDVQWPEPTNNEQKQTRNHQHQVDFKIILRNGPVGYLLQQVSYPTFDCNHSSIASQRIMVKIERLRFVYYHTYLLRDMTFTGYIESHFDTRKFKFTRQKSTLWI